MGIIGTIVTVLSVAESLKQALESKELIENFFDFGLNADLDELKGTVDKISAVLRDAETKQELSHQLCHQIEELKDAFFDADDLLDELLTLQSIQEEEVSFCNKVSRFFSRYNPIWVSYWRARGIKDIKKKLDTIARNAQFGFNHDPEPIRKRRPETGTYANEVEIIIGRGEDLEKIVGMLLDPNVQQDLSFLCIFGIGGLGKTALAQLVFNDPRVTSAFPLRLWTCVSDQDHKQLDVKEVLENILASATRSSRDGGSSFDLVQSKLRQELAGKRYLLVLDDVWTEERDHWCELLQYLLRSPRGSWIVVTTRSERTATIIGGQRHELQGLSEVDSWRLFERTAFGSDESNPRDEDLDKLGREIVDECARVPLAIKVLGSFLYGQEKSMWQSVKKAGLANIRKSRDDIMSILQLSYHHLELPLKSCFSYCALFPKDFRMYKDTLIDLWMAQGYLVPLSDGQSAENAGEECFSMLLKRCFFQDIKRDEDGEIVSCKMHDLLHDLAQSVSEKEIYVATSSKKINEKARHFSFSIKDFGKHSLDKSRIRSYIHLREIHRFYRDEVDEAFVLISDCRALRALDLAGLSFCLPDSISKLLHLRYLDLSGNNDLKVLPQSFSKLYNLQTLKLDFCPCLKELPKDMSKLVKLRALDISCSGSLEYMPRGMDKLTCLSRLSHFLVGSEGSNVSWKQWYDGLQELKALNGLEGKLMVEIKWPKNGDNIVSEVKRGKGCILRNTEHLERILICFKEKKDDDGRMDDEGRIALMEDLHPHSNLKSLEVWDYKGTRMPDWASLLRNLVKLHLLRCKHIKEWRRGIDGSSSGSGNNNPELQSLPCLPHLTSLSIINCRQLRWIPLCPKLEFLFLKYFNKKLVFGSTSICFKEVEIFCHKLKKITIDNAAWLNSLPKEAFQCLETLKIQRDDKVEKLGEVEEVFRSCSSSLRTLKIKFCEKLSIVSGGLEHLTALEVLELSHFKLSEEEKEGIMPCPSLLPSLRTLSFGCYKDFEKMENLPNWMQLLPALQTLNILKCPRLKAMPNWMPKLTSLRDLNVSLCSERLKRRCQEEPQGEDWPFIQHIPSILFKKCHVYDVGTPQRSIQIYLPNSDSDSDFDSDSDLDSDLDIDTDTDTEEVADAEAEADADTNTEAEADTDT